MTEPTTEVLARLLKGDPNRFFVLRDTGDDAYPRIDDPSQEPPRRTNRWRIRRVTAFDGTRLTMVLASHHAWFDPASGRWDRADAWNMAVLSPDDDPWNGMAVPETAPRIEAAARAAGPNRALATTLATIPVAWIARIDERGDGLSRFAHLYVNPATDTGYAYDSIVPSIGLTGGSERLTPDPARRIQWFDPADRAIG